MSRNCQKCKLSGIDCLDITTCPNFSIVAQERDLSPQEFYALFGNVSPAERKPKQDEQSSAHIEHTTGWDTLAGNLL